MTPMHPTEAERSGEIIITEATKEALDDAYEDGRHDAIGDIAYGLSRFATGINPSAVCPACHRAIGYSRNCGLCKAATEMMSR